MLLLLLVLDEFKGILLNLISNHQQLQSSRRGDSSNNKNDHNNELDRDEVKLIANN